MQSQRNKKWPRSPMTEGWGDREPHIHRHPGSYGVVDPPGDGGGGDGSCSVSLLLLFYLQYANSIYDKFDTFGTYLTYKPFKLILITIRHFSKLQRSHLPRGLFFHNRLLRFPFFKKNIFTDCCSCVEGLRRPSSAAHDRPVRRTASDGAIHAVGAITPLTPHSFIPL